jgi:hypothetical protein
MQRHGGPRRGIYTCNPICQPHPRSQWHTETLVGIIGLLRFWLDGPSVEGFVKLATWCAHNC